MYEIRQENKKLDPTHTDGLTDYDFHLFYNNSIHSHNTRSNNNLRLPKPNSNCGKQKPTYLATINFNELNNSDTEDVDSLLSCKAYYTIKFCYYKNGQYSGWETMMIS